MAQHRQLAAIMFTDIEGYTSIMQHDEKEAVGIRERHRTAFEMTTEAFSGKIIQYFGDGTLSVFTSTVEAVDCAIELQRAFLEEPKIPVRIGIHVGDIIYSEDDIIGDAVNVASRIESCAVSGSILISDKVHDQIRSQRHIETKFLDAYELKNVDVAMPIFAVSNEGLVIPKPEEVKGKLKATKDDVKKKPSKRRVFILTVSALLLLVSVLFGIQYFSGETKQNKDLSIAVLPFDNLSTDKDSEFFRDGITEDILTQLSKLKALRVISRTSVMHYKETNKTIPEIAKELGVSYVLQGSIRKYDNDIRIAARLIDASSAEHVWAENYDKTLTDIFGLQSEVSKEIVDALEINMSFDEKQGLNEIPTQNIEAYKLFLQGRKEADKRNSESIAKSITLYEDAIALDPKYAEAYAEIANSIYLETYYSRRNPAEASALANDYLDQAEKINDKVSRIYSVRGLISNIEGKREEAIKAFEKAIRLSPNDLTARHQYATFFYYTKQYEKQLEQAKIAYSLDPLSFATANGYATALAFNHKYDESERLLKKLEALNDGGSQFVLNRSFFRLYFDQDKFKEAIKPLEAMVKEEPVFYRFLGFSYAKTGDTIGAYRIMDSIKKRTRPQDRAHQIAVVYAGLQKRDSVLFYLDTVRNKHAKTIKREAPDIFRFLKDDPEFKAVLKTHGIETY